MRNHKKPLTLSLSKGCLRRQHSPFDKLGVSALLAAALVATPTLAQEQEAPPVEVDIVGGGVQ